MKVRKVILQPLRRGLQHIGKPPDSRRVALVLRQLGKSGIQSLQRLHQSTQALLVKHHQSPTWSAMWSARVTSHQSLPYCHTLSNCPAVLNKSSCACCFWKFASRYAIHFSFSSSRAFSTSRKFSFPSVNCACSTVTFCCASCNSNRATSFPASRSRTRLVFCRTSAVTSIFLLARLAFDASRCTCASPMAAFVCALKSGT